MSKCYGRSNTSVLGLGWGGFRRGKCIRLFDLDWHWVILNLRACTFFHFDGRLHCWFSDEHDGNFSFSLNVNAVNLTKSLFVIQFTEKSILALHPNINFFPGRDCHDDFTASTIISASPTRSTPTRSWAMCWKGNKKSMKCGYIFHQVKQTSKTVIIALLASSSQMPTDAA